MPRWARSLRRFSTTDGMGLLIIGVASFLRGVSYLDPFLDTDRTFKHVAETWMPMPGWSAVWMVSGLVCLVASFRWYGRLAAFAVGSSVGLYFLFGCSFLWGSLLGSSPRGWVSSLAYFATAFLVLWAIGRGRRADAGGDRRW